MPPGDLFADRDDLFESVGVSGHPGAIWLQALPGATIGVRDDLVEVA